ncbi:MAG: ThuA domain-containing protein [Acidobacteriota bacterium]
MSVGLLAQQPPPAPVPGAGPRGRGPLGGAQAGFVLAPSFDTTPPTLPNDLKSGGVLIFSKTNGYRDEASMRASDAALVAIAAVRGWPVFVTENGAVMNDTQLARFNLVVWNNSSGDVLTAEQRAAFRAWVERGGSYLGIHGAGGDPVISQGHTSLADWKWYVDTLVGAQFVVHSSIMPGDIHIEDPKSPITKGLPATWHRAEEWYAFEKSPRALPSVRILATVDEKSYTPGRATMGGDHPLVWWHCVDKGHAVYSALGHAGEMYAEPLMIRLLDNAMGWLVDASGKPCK